MLLATLRFRRALWSRRALAIFATAWLALALQPCAMALTLDDHDCPHCPPAEHPPCETRVEVECSWDEPLAQWPRDQILEVDDKPDELPLIIAVPPPAQRLQTETGAVLRPRDLPLLAGSGPPLNVLHCVYLK